jgi:hypothetical protein
MPFLISTAIIIAIAAIGLIAAYLRMEIKLPKANFIKKHFDILVVFVIFFAALFSAATLITGFYGSTIDDGADHTLMTRIILDNPNALLTFSTQPYANIPLNYPVATHALSAFFVTLLGVPIEKIIIMLSVILPSLIAISFFSTIKCLFGNKFLSIIGLVIAAFFTIGLTWGPISWGGVPLLLSFYISITSLGLIFAFVIKKKMTPLNAFFIGLIFFLASRTYPVVLLIVSIWFLLILIAKLLVRLRNVHGWMISVPRLFSKTNMVIAIAFSAPILLNVPYFSFIYTQNVRIIQSNLLDSAAISASERVKTLINFNWLFDIPALSQFFSGFGRLFILASFSIILLIGVFVLLLSRRATSKFFSREFACGLLLVYSLMLLIILYLALTLYLPINFLTTFLNPERVWHHIFIPATIMTAVVLSSSVYILCMAIKRLFNRGKTKVWKLSSKTLACTLLVLVIFSAAPLAIPVIEDQQKGYNETKFMLNKFKTLNQDDILLMHWIKETIHSPDHILVSSGDSGQFLSAVTQRQTISYYSRFKNYSDLMSLLTSNSSNLKAIPLMLEYNVSYVYIGSTAITYSLEYSYRRQFNATQFLSTPYFTLTKEIGNAWLFQFNASAALAAYEAAGPLPEFVDQPQFSHYINILASEGGYTGPPAGYHYGSGVLAIYAYPNEGYQLNHWKLNGSYLCGAENPVNVDYWNWNVQAVFTKNT